MRSDSLAHGVDAAGLQLRGGLFAEPELDGAESALTWRLADPANSSGDRPYQRPSLA
jgi:hypothetical protein